MRSPKHLNFIRSLPCTLCGAKAEAAHIRMGTKGGTGFKPSDCHTVPLCHEHHAEQHRIGETRFWGCVNKSLLLAAFLYKNSGDDEACRLKIAEFRREFYNKK